MTDWGFSQIIHTFNETLAPFQIDSTQSVSGPFNTTATLVGNLSTSKFVGRGFLPPDVGFSDYTAGSDNPNVTVRNSGGSTFFGAPDTTDGTETVTYYYGVLLPEPASWGMLATGMLAILACGLRARIPSGRRKPGQPHGASCASR